MRNLLVLIVILFLTGCKSTYEDTLTGRDVDQKETLAFKLYEEKDYFKAGELFKSLIQDKKSGEDIEKMFFFYAMCDYYLEDYGLAAYEFERLIQKFPRGKYNEESQYFIAMSNYKKSPPYFLDQDYTYRAIESFQLFLDKYPKSTKREDVNNKVDELTDKLEFKMYRQAKLFYHMEEYKSANVALEKVVSEFPDSKHAEEVYYLIAESNFKLAQKSIESKQIERFNKAVNASGSFNKKFRESIYQGRLDNIITESKREIKRLKVELPDYYHKSGDFEKSISLYETLLRRAKTLETQQEFALKLFSVHHSKCQKASTQTKLKSYEDLMKYFNELSEPNRTYIETKNRREVESAKLGYELYKTDAAYKLYKEGKYYSSMLAYRKLLADSSVQNKPKDWYFYIKSNFQYAITQEALLKKDQLDSMVFTIKAAKNEIGGFTSGYQSKIDRMKVIVDENLALYPVLLVEEPYRNGKYKIGLGRAQNLLKTELSKKDEEEIVYLLIATAVKHANKGKRFERFSRFSNAEKLMEKYFYRVESKEVKLKISKLKHKIDKGLFKYKTKEE